MTGKRLLIVSPADTRSGAGIFRHVFTCAMRRAGYSVAIAQPEEQGPYQTAETALGIEHHFFSRRPDPDFIAFANDRPLAEAELTRSQPDLVVFSSGLSPLCVYSFLEAAAARQIPYLLIEHQVARRLYIFEAAVAARYSVLYRQAKALIAVSEENLATLRRCLSLPAEIGRVIRPGRPANFFRPRDEAARAALRREWGVSPHAFVALSVAKLEPVKGHRFQIDALQRLKAGRAPDDFVFVWIGDGFVRGELERLVAERGLDNHVRLLGHRFDVAPLYDGGDVFVLTSTSEGMPLTVMEAMAKGLPPVCSDVGGNAEAVGDAGVVLPPFDGSGRVAVELAATLQRLHADPAGVAALSARARQRAAALFREDRMIEEYRDLVARSLREAGA